MGSTNAIRGWLGIILVAVLAPWMFMVVYPGWKTGLVLILLGMGAVAGLALVVRQRGIGSLAALGHRVDGFFQSMAGGSGRSQRARRVPRPTSYWKAQLIEAVGGQCELQTCSKIDHLEVHHIDEHARGGGNALHNLLVLCPNHHKLADSRGINKSRQKTLAKRAKRFRDASFSNRWSKSVVSKERSKDDELDFSIGI